MTRGPWVDIQWYMIAHRMIAVPPCLALRLSWYNLALALVLAGRVPLYGMCVCG